MKIKTKEVCYICGGEYEAKGLCKLHYSRLQKHRNLAMPINTKHNKYRIENGIAYFEILNKFHEPIGEFIVDEDVVEKINQYKWSELNTGYIAAYKGGKTILLHRFVTNCPNDRVVDHINHNVKDNRLSNLRVCTQKENMKNVSRNPKHYSEIKRKNRTYYSIQINGIYKGLCKSEEEAKERVKAILQEDKQ